MRRRDFLTRVSAAAPLLGVQTATPAARRSSEPARHAQDDWLDEAPAAHRASTRRYAKPLTTLSAQSLRLAVCGVTLKGDVEIVAKATDVSEDAVRTKLTANLIGRAVVVPTGIITVTRAGARLRARQHRMR